MDPMTLMMIASSMMQRSNQKQAQGKAEGVSQDMQMMGAVQQDIAQRRDLELGDAPPGTVPKSYDDYINLLQKNQRQQMPGYGLLKQGIEQTTSAGITGIGQLAGSGPQALGALGGLMQGRQQMLRQLGVTAAQFQQGAEQQYQGAVGGRAQYEQQIQDREFLLWQMKKNEIMGQRNVGMQMQFQGADMGAAAGIQGLNMSNQNMWAQNMNPMQFGGGGQGYPQGGQGGGSMNPNWNPTIPSGYGNALI